MLESSETHELRIIQVPNSNVLTIQLLAGEDLTIDDGTVPQDRQWSYYLDSFVLEQPTEGVGSEVRAPLLHRSVNS